MTLKWVSVTTVHAPVWLIRLHANYMRQMGARDIIYFLDQPDAYSEDDLAGLSALATIIKCDAAYWMERAGRPKKVPLRQLKNVAFARKTIAAEWFFHIDIDEFPYIPQGVDSLIDSMAADVCEIHIANGERVMVHGDLNWHTGILRLPNTDKEKQREHYGPIAAFFGNGLAEYYHGKSIVRNRKNIIQGGHGAYHADMSFEVIRFHPPISKSAIFHYPCISQKHYIHRVKSKITIPDEEKSLKLRHQYALERWIREAGDVEARGQQAFRIMHTCSPQQASAWIEARLCAQIPERFIKAIEQAADTQTELRLSFADSSIANFYSKPKPPVIIYSPNQTSYVMEDKPIDGRLEKFIASLPKVELHLHLEGALPPQFIVELARRNKIAIPSANLQAFLLESSFPNFRAFANRFLFNAHCLRTERDFSDSVLALGAFLSKSNVRFAEVMWTPQLYLNRNIPLDKLLAALNHGRDIVRVKYGIELRWIVDLVRNYPGDAFKIAEWASRPEVKAAGVVALGLGGQEEGHPAAPFKEIFAKARAIGIGANPHAGETVGPSSITETLNHLQPDRIAHGIRATEDTALLDRLSKERIILDICPSSNVQLGVRPDYAALKLTQLRDAGCRITINTDDPALFATSLNREYLLAVSQCGLSASDLAACIVTAVEAARLPDSAKADLYTAIVPEVTRLLDAFKQN